MTDGERRGDSKYRSAARHRAAWRRPESHRRALIHTEFDGRREIRCGRDVIARGPSLRRPAHQLDRLLGSDTRT